MSVAENLTATLNKIFANGRGEAGLEVGVDPGLAISEHIRIPRSMVKAWAGKIKPGTENERAWRRMTGSTVPAPKGKKKGQSNEPSPSSSPSAVDIREYPGTPGECVHLPGWLTRGDITIVDQTYSVTRVVSGESLTVELDEFYVDPFTSDDIRNFWTVNQGHIVAPDFDEATQMWIHAIRFWSVVSGFVVTTHSKEYLVIEDPDEVALGADEFVPFAVDYRSNAWTACAARAGTWRKTNHATGGDIVAGFARRWLSKMGYMPTETNREARVRAEKSVTRAFYIATHAACVHSILANMAHADPNHWARVNPAHGLITSWDIKDSALIRMVPNTQVAGGAMVADAVVVLGMLVKEGLAPMLESVGEVKALVSSYESLRDGGIKCATYAKWFLDGHPKQASFQVFNQKDPAHAALIGELGQVADKYYKGTTIADSAALKSAASQMASTTCADTWAAIGRRKQTLSSEQVVAAYSALRGASAADAVARLTSKDEGELRNAVGAYNVSNAAIAKLIGIMNPAVADADVIIGQRSTASAQVGPN
jgi:hypothetical protein